MAKTFNVVNISKTKDSFLSFCGCKETVSCAFESGYLGGSISKGNRYMAGFNIMQITENRSIVACSTTVREPIIKIWRSKALICRHGIIWKVFSCISIGR